MRGKIAFLLLRISVGVVFLIFGIGKLQNDYWAQTIKAMSFFEQLPWSVNISVLFIGIVEILTGAALMIGLFTRFFAALAAAQLTAILILLNFQEIRDVGLLGAAVYMIFYSENFLGIDCFLKKKKSG